MVTRTGSISQHGGEESISAFDGRPVDAGAEVLCDGVSSPFAPETFPRSMLEIAQTFRIPTSIPGTSSALTNRNASWPVLWRLIKLLSSFDT